MRVRYIETKSSHKAKCPADSGAFFIAGNRKAIVDEAPGQSHAAHH